MKYKVKVERIYYVEHIVDAEGIEHAQEIGSEISDEMPVDWTTFVESNWEVDSTEQGCEVTYTPAQDYLK